jgi:hypothetical protein
MQDEYSERFEYGAYPDSTKSRRFLLLTDQQRIVPGSAILDVDVHKTLTALTIIIERRHQDRPEHQAGVSIVSVRNYQNQPTTGLIYLDTTLPSPINEFLYDIRAGREWTKDAETDTYWPLPIRPIVIHGRPNRLPIINLVGETYIFIHDVDTAVVKVFYRSATNPDGANKLHATVLLVDQNTKETTTANQDPLEGFEWIESRGEFGVDGQKESYATASSDVRATIISNADPATARQLCQLDRQHRMICRDRLPQEKKYQLCLGRDRTARECDRIPMFSQQQFMRLIPRELNAHPDDFIPMTNEFYLQQYKLSTEGFATAIRKAKLMNEICAIVLPEFLVSESARQLTMPGYIDVGIIDEIIGEYKKALKEPKGVRWIFNMSINLYDFKASQACNIVIGLGKGEQPNTLYPSRAAWSFDYMTSQSAKAKFITRIKNDPYLQSFIRFIEAEDGGEPRSIFLLKTQDEDSPPVLDAFKLSRLLKIAFDMDYVHNAMVYLQIGAGETIQIPL